jgi:hypothetical protein
VCLCDVRYKGWVSFLRAIELHFLGDFYFCWECENGIGKVFYFELVGRYRVYLRIEYFILGFVDF